MKFIQRYEVVMLVHSEKSRLAWHCRRGMLELDLILQKFFDKHIDNLNEQHIQYFDLLLEQTDPELFAWLLDFTDPEDERLKEIVHIIRTSD